MFGQNNQSQQNDNQIPDQSIEGAMGDDANHAASLPAPQDWQHPGQPLDHEAQPDAQPDVHHDAQPVDNTDNTPMITPSDNQSPALVTPSGNDDDTPAAPAPADDASTNDLLDIKQQALGQLSPLVGHLDQSPEEKFRTTMMMIQASDNQGLVRVAFEAAQQIPDEKARAQALLDVINEINYFTQHQQQS